MHTFLHRVGGSAAAHPWRTVAVWLVLLVTTLGLAGAVGGTLQDDYDVPGAPSQAGLDLLHEQFPQLAGSSARVVLHDRSGLPLDAGVVDAVRAGLERVAHVALVRQAVPSADGDTALIEVAYDVPVTDLGGARAVEALRTAAGPAARAGLQVELGGELPENSSAPSGTAELVGIGAALVILLLAFGTVVAAGLPLAVAFVGLGIGSAGITLLAAVQSVSPTAPSVASMVGLGVGIDYALLLVTRHVEGLRSGLPVREAAALATATAGSSIVFAGSTVLVSLLGLRLVGLPTYASFGYATGITVLVVLLTSLTLVPALCGLAGTRLLRRSERAAVAAGTPSAVTIGSPRTAAWARRVGRNPLPWALGALAVVLALAAPVLDMRTWPQDAGSQPTSNTTRRAYDVVTAEYGPGANGPFVVAVDLAQVPAATLDGLAARLRATPGVSAVTPPQLSPSGGAAVLVLQPSTGPQDEATTALVDRLRADVLPGGAHLTGTTPGFADISRILADRLWLVVGAVVAMSLLLLTVVFRAPVVAVKAAVMNLLSVAAAYGVMTAVFQWGWGTSLLGLPHAVPVSSWVPVLMFAILFGLSMDYEVFLLSRIREDWLATGDAHGSVERGLARTGRVITSAAAIMIAVFVGFGLDSDVTVKMIGVGMAVAVLVDATLVRMVLVPATMALLGSANWWLPAWLDRLLPHLDLEGGTAALPGGAAPETTQTASPRDAVPVA